jgi:hypothetical protein
MKQLLRILLLLSITALMASCKLAVIVVEGGEVEADGSGTCVASSICIVEVTDPNFSETFVAVPDTDWYFQKWNLGSGFFCGGSTSAICKLSFKDHEESEAVADMVASSELFYLMPVFKPYQDIITVNGNEWLQPALFNNLSWNDINAVCPEGVCAGMLSGYDMTGWTWASVDDVNALFNHYIGSDVLGPGPDDYEAEGPWAAAFFADGWFPNGNSDDGVTKTTDGWVRDKSEEESACSATLRDVLHAPVPDNANTDCEGDVLHGSMYIGGWFYRVP